MYERYNSFQISILYFLVAEAETVSLVYALGDHNRPTWNHFSSGIQEREVVERHPAASFASVLSKLYRPESGLLFVHASKLVATLSFPYSPTSRSKDGIQQSSLAHKSTKGSLNTQTGISKATMTTICSLRLTHDKLWTMLVNDYVME